jgi:glycine/D-amino acid oxidase-like deaminating enzyme
VTGDVVKIKSNATRLAARTSRKAPARAGRAKAGSASQSAEAREADDFGTPRRPGGFQGWVAEHRQHIAQRSAVLRASGMAMLKAGTFTDLEQLVDFAKLAASQGHLADAMTPPMEVVRFILEHPEDALRILRSMDKLIPDTWAQKSRWMAEGPKRVDVNVPHAPTKSADVVIIGAGISGASLARRLADDAASGGKPQRVLVVDRDSEDGLSHAATLRNGGMVCTALDYIFSLDDVMGEKAIGRIQHALSVGHEQASKIYGSLIEVLRGATDRIEQFAKEKGVDIEFHREGSVEIATDAEELADFKTAVAKAREMGFDWNVVDAQYLEDKHGLAGPSVAGGLEFNDWAVVHSGKLVKALFDHATRTDSNLAIQANTEVLDATPKPDGSGWRLNTTQGVIEAANVVDAREGFAPYSWREGRYSQIHAIRVPEGTGLDKLGYTGVNHGMSYMRREKDVFMVGGGDSAVKDKHHPPVPLGSVVLYSAAMFKKMYPDVPFDIERAWGGMFALDKDELPTAGELLDKWYVMGGYGGTGLSFAPAMADEIASSLLGKAIGQPIAVADAFGPRRFFLQHLREELAKRLTAAGVPTQPDAISLQVQQSDVKTAPPAPRRVGALTVLTLREHALDAMNPDAAAVLPKGEARADRAQLEEQWLREQVAALSGSSL